MTYPAARFLTGIEAALIKNDFDRMLETSCHVSVITGEYKEPVNPVVDEVYGSVTADSWSLYTFTGRALQEIVKIRDEDLLGFGILEIGDCIFYLRDTDDLSQGYPQTLEFIDPGGLRWIPVPRVQKQFYAYLLHRIGQSQVAQVVPCKIKK